MADQCDDVVCVPGNRNRGWHDAVDPCAFGVCRTDTRVGH